MNEIFLFLTDGFEEIEALGTVDVLRRANLAAQTVSLTASQSVAGGHGIRVQADRMFDSTDFSQARMLVIPGGTTRFNEHEGLRDLVREFAARGGRVAAICAAPMVLGTLGLLRGKRATAYPGFEQYLEGATFTPDPVVVDGNIITGRGPGFTLQFALEIVRRLEGDAAADSVATGLLLK